MAEVLRSVGLDVGTTSTQMVLSELTVENKAGSFSVPEMEIGQRKILYKSPVYFTPLITGELVDAAALREIIRREYEAAGITRESVDTGAIIVTGETSRKENAEAVLHELSGFAGEFVVATAGPELESVLAAQGAGAVAYSARTGKTVLHMDIGGGTSNLALIRDGKIEKCGCLNVGGRLMKFGEDGEILYASPVLRGICDRKVGEIATQTEVMEIARILAEALEMAAGLREPTELLEHLWTKEAGEGWHLDGEETVISFSGGVADCIRQEMPWLEFGDMGPELGRAIWESRLCQGVYTLGEETIRATVIGAGCHSAQLSGSTVFHRGVEFPLKNIPVREKFGGEEPAVLAMAGLESPSYGEVLAMAKKIAGEHKRGPVLVCLQADMAKALGQALAMKLPKETPILCIDRVKLKPGDYLDVGAPVGPALPVVVKTLVLGST